MKNYEIASLLADESADVVSRSEALIDVGRQRLAQFADRVAEFLADQHFMLRGAAIKSLLLFWEKAEFVSKAIEILNRDSHEFVRNDAASALMIYGELHAERRDEIIRALSRAVAVDREALVRETAYDGVIALTSTKLPPRKIDQVFDEQRIRWDVINPYLEPELRKKT